MARWIRGFLCDRKACVRIDGTIGSKRKIKQGVPQGSVLSPLLFLFYINGIRETVPEGVKISMYTDDIAIWAQDPIKTEAERKVQLAVAKISAWSKAHKLILNPLKCESSHLLLNLHTLVITSPITGNFLFPNTVICFVAEFLICLEFVSFVNCTYLSS